MMPGRGSYGPNGKWVYERAKHIRVKSPDMPESEAFAIATQQAHKLGKSNKTARTRIGVEEAKAKYNAPKSTYQLKAAGVMMGSFLDELSKIPRAGGALRKVAAALKYAEVPGSLSQRASLGAPGAWGGLGKPSTGSPSHGAGTIPSPSAPTPPPTQVAKPPSIGPAAKAPSQSSLGIPSGGATTGPGTAQGGRELMGPPAPPTSQVASPAASQGAPSAASHTPSASELGIPS
jgi:hypothetical protein